MEQEKSKPPTAKYNGKAPGNVKANKQTVIDAIIDQIKQGKATEKICAAICTKFQFTERTFYNRFKIAQEQHSSESLAIKEAIAKVGKQAAIDARIKAIMTSDERKEYLTKLILGEIKIPYSEKKWNPGTKKFQTLNFVELPGHAARVSAIAELNRMEGDYQPTKVTPTDPAGNEIVLTALSPADLNTLLALKMRVNQGS
jgi:hypothetical protein